MGAEKKKWVPITAMEAAALESLKGNESIPSSSLSIDTSLPLPQLRPQIIELCKDLFKEWSCLDDSHFSIETVSGGITNLLLKVSVREDSNIDAVSLTVRLYGPNTDLVIDRERESQDLVPEKYALAELSLVHFMRASLLESVYKHCGFDFGIKINTAIPYLSAAGFGAKLLGLFRNGTVQSYIDARTLSPSDMSKPVIAAEIAKQLHKFHQVEIPGSREPQLWNDIAKFLEKAAVLKFDDREKQARYETISFREIHEEVNAMKNLTDKLKAPVVFAHNDLLSGNLMLNDAERKLYFIDFEYGSYSYRGYDIANHFNEYAGFDCDYNLYPDMAAQYHFFRNYLQPNNPQEASDEDLKTIYVETSLFKLASHIYWALWALIQAKVSSIDFDYLSYFFLRYDEFKKQKENSFLLAEKYLSGSCIG